jgi:hypothetical protein
VAEGNVKFPFQLILRPNRESIAGNMSTFTYTTRSSCRATTDDSPVCLPWCHLSQALCTSDPFASLSSYLQTARRAATQSRHAEQARRAGWISALPVSPDFYDEKRWSSFLDALSLISLSVPFSSEDCKSDLP